MKKATLLAFAFAMFAGAQSIVAQEPAENVQYVSDPSQGVLLNRMQDNWFITAEGGANIYFSHKSIHRDLSDRFSPAASIYAGKWFTPVFGARAGVTWMQLKGLADGPGYIGTLKYDYRPDGFYKQRTQEIGPVFDLMVNLTNWWCGYKPNRVYNAYFYAGGALYWTMAKYPTNAAATEFEWKNAHDKIIALRAGLTQEFNLSRHFALGLDLRATAMDNHIDGNGKMQFVGEALISATYKFGNSEWSAPVVPVCPPAENCDEYRARLQAADARIADLESQLKACLSRPVEKQVVVKAPLATIYYPIGVYRLTSVDRKVLNSVANVMKADTSKKYTLTGWADNYTGTDAINTRLRENRVNTVKNQLVKYGVSANQLNATTNNGNRVDLGDKCLTLDRAVTIEVAE